MSDASRFALAALLVCAVGCKPAPGNESATMGGETASPAAGLSPQDEAAVRAVDEAWGKAAAANDGKAIAALYADDATLLPPTEPVKKGAEAKKYWTDFTDAYTGTIDLTTTAVEGRGDLAYNVGTYRSTVTPKKAGAKPFPTEEGKYVEVLKKQSDGSWKIVYDIWNTDAPPPKQ
jgi:uncharacterized protein (TIGR02246 family)